MRKIFTVEQANRTLPLVRKIVADIVAAHTRWQEHIAGCEAMAAVNDPAKLEVLAALQRATQQIAEQIDAYIRELRALGIEFKGVDPGLIDFPAEMFGRQVYLCWRLGESAVEYWHDTDAGFAGRQRIPSEVMA
jgi:hypothetical protein